MLETIRKYTGSLFVKLLFVLLILSFGVWGVADVFRPGGGRDWAIRVGDVEIPPETIREDYQRELNRLRQVMGEGITEETARAFGLPNQVISGVVARTLLDLESERLGLVVTDDAVRAAVQADPSFQGPAGTFDPEVFRRVLQVNGLTEDAFVRLVRGDMVRRMLISSVAGGASVPKAMVEELYRFREERRIADYVFVPTSAAGDVGQPNETQIKDFYEAHAERFSSPEYRSATAVVLSAPAVAASLKVPEAELEEAYAARQGEFVEPERRTFEQVLVADDATAQAVRERLLAGGEPATVAGDFAGKNASAVRLDDMSEAQLPGELARAAFALSPGAVSEPVRTALGWHVLKGVAVQPLRERSLPEVREQLAAELAQAKAVDEVYALSTRLEDALGGGASLEDAAASLGLDVRRLDAVDAGGRDPSGAVVADLPDGFAATLFSAAEKTESVLTESGRDTFYVVRTDAVRPAGVKPPAEVRNEVITAWTAERRAERTRAIATSVAEAARGSGTLAAAADRNGLVVRTTPPFVRSPSQPVEGVPPALIADVFAAKQGKIRTIDSDGGTYVARVSAVVEADPGAAPAAVEALQRELDAEAEGDTLAQFTTGLRETFPVTMNPSVLGQMF